MTGQELARRHTAAQVAQAEDDRHWTNLQRKAVALAKAGSLVPKDIRGNPDAALAACIVLDEYGVSISPVTLKQLHFIDGVPEPSAQLQAGLLAAYGYRVEWLDLGPERCEGRLQRPDGTVTTPIAWTIQQARSAGLLDVWVERWQSYQRADGSKGNKLERFVLGRDGVDTPDWVDELVRAGLARRNENWHRYPDDMLASKVIRRLVKRFAADILLGTSAFADIDPAPRAAAADGVDDDQELEDVEDVGVAQPAPPAQPDGDQAGELVDDSWLQRYAIRCADAAKARDLNPDDIRHAVALTVTRGRSNSSKGILAGVEATTAMRLAVDVHAGRAHLHPYPADPTLQVVAMGGDQ